MVAFYIMSSGTHPYERNGETFLTEWNIVHDSPDLSAVQDMAPYAWPGTNSRNWV